MPVAFEARPLLPLLMIAGEVSGEQHGAALVRALHERLPHLQVYGVGGDTMRAAGVETLFDISVLNVVGAVEVLAKIPAGLKMARRLLRTARHRGTRAVVLIDAPGFNLLFARWAKNAGLRVIYYVSPQIWAWRQGRVHKVARRVDKMLTLFPFEVPFYTAVGVDAECVGHPLLDDLTHLPARAQAAGVLGLDARRPIVALLPGSRRQEIVRLLPPMLEALRRVQQHMPQVQGVIPVASTIAPHLIQQLLQRVAISVTIVSGQSHMALRAANFALVASGTATLEAGLIGTPMVIVYRVHPVTAWLARRLIRIPHIGLVNIVAGRCLVPELVQDAVQPGALAALVLNCLAHPEETQRVQRALASLHDILGARGCAQRAAACVRPFLCQQAEQVSP